MDAHERLDFSPITARRKFEWPGGKRLAVWFSINIETFSYGVMQGIQYTPGQTAPDNANWSWREYGNRVGVWRILELCEELEVPVSAILNSRVIRDAPQVAQALKEQGCEIVAHGRTNSESQNALTETDERALIEEATAELTAAFGVRPVGWMSPGINSSTVTTDLLEELGYTYSLDWPLDDQPVWLRTRGGGRILAVPYPTDINDITFLATHHGLAGAFADAVVDNFDEMLEQSVDQPLVFGFSVHTFLSGQPYRMRQLRRALRHMRERSDDVWWTTSREITEYFATLAAEDGVDAPGAPSTGPGR